MEFLSKEGLTYFWSKLKTRFDNLTEATNTNTTNIAVQTARIDSIASLPEGSTTGDAELIDIRVGADGTTYSTAGDAVRGQVDDLKNQVDEINPIVGLYLPDMEVSTGSTFTYYPVDMPSESVSRTLTIRWGASGGYCAYGLYLNDALVWGIGNVADSSLLWVGANQTKTFTIPANIEADSFGFRNRNGKSGITVSISSDYIRTSFSSINNSIADEYDSTKTYNRGDYCRVGNVIKRCIVGITTAEAYTSWKWEDVSIINDITVPIEETLYKKDIPWIGGESIAYDNGEVVSASGRARTDFVSNVEEVIGGNYTFATFVYKNGVYQGLVHSDGSVSIPSSSTILLSYVNLSAYDSRYSFRFCRYDSGTSLDRSTAIEIKLKRFDSVENTAPQDFIVTVGTGKQYTSLRTALEYAATIANKKRHVVVRYYGNGVEYDVMDDIADADLTEESSFIGLVVPAYTKLLGMGSWKQNKISLTLPEGTDSDVAFRISTINLVENAELENLWLYGKRCRYACHDDTQTYDPEWALKTVKNCRFTSDYTNQHRAYGAGYRSGINWRFENCIFENINGEETTYGNAAFSAHNNNAIKKTPSITFINCQFDGGHGVGFSSLNATTGQSYPNAQTAITFYGCKSVSHVWGKSVVCSLPTDTVPSAVLELTLTGFGNNFGSGDIGVYSTAGATYVHTFDDQITVWGKITE